MEKSRRVKIRTKENSSRLVINELDVLDSGFYQCIASNSAASVNTTSILRVSLVIPHCALVSKCRMHFCVMRRRANRTEFGCLIGREQAWLLWTIFGRLDEADEKPLRCPSSLISYFFFFWSDFRPDHLDYRFANLLHKFLALYCLRFLPWKSETMSIHLVFFIPFKKWELLRCILIERFKFLKEIFWREGLTGPSCLIDEPAGPCRLSRLPSLLTLSSSRGHRGSNIFVLLSLELFLLFVFLHLPKEKLDGVIDNPWFYRWTTDSLEAPDTINHGRTSGTPP